MSAEDQPAAILHLQKCMIRPYYVGDAEASAKEANNPKIAQFMRNTFPSPYEVKDALWWINLATSASPMRDFAICDPETGVLIGGIGLKARDDIQARTMEVGYWLGESHWGRGVATEALSAFAKWAFESFPQAVRLEAEVFSNNKGSARVLEKTGFVFEGRKRNAVEKNGQLLDVLVYGALREELELGIK
ncbi:acyl-CoA N-acyltransferase [Stachybotrys elegans]|uniref:Acyl-CoA N-acyltransferase n=1 Tax=Stachybotrys elegans TaxID=80388 RepID=A0A8K0SGN6_9HYPO|nr:acyl-CoA N-acyltransferase [Stachybotrys elegans]